MKPSHKLAPELIPKPLYRISGYRALKKSTAWKAIAKETRAEAGDKCKICDSTDRPECNEKWDYDDQKTVATLVGFEVRCKTCHFATHFGHTMILGPKYVRIAVDQICKVNGCTVKDVKQIVDAAWSLWEKRSRKEWTVVVAPKLLKRYPRLQAVSLLYAEKNLRQGR
jgi:hypothetical protein